MNQTKDKSLNAYQKPVTFKNVILFTLPTIAMSLFMSFYTMVDGLFVSRLIGTNALSAINLTAPVISLVTAVSTMLATGGSAVIMKKVEQKNTKAVEKWNQYLDNLAILISNLRMAYDTDIILGGEVGGYLSEYMIPLGEKVMAYNGFEHDVRYLKNCSYKREASAVGAAKHFLSEYIQHL